MVTREEWTDRVVLAVFFGAILIKLESRVIQSSVLVSVSRCPPVVVRCSSARKGASFVGSLCPEP